MISTAIIVRINLFGSFFTIMTLSPSIDGMVLGFFTLNGKQLLS